MLYKIGHRAKVQDLVPRTSQCSTFVRNRKKNCSICEPRGGGGGVLNEDNYLDIWDRPGAGLVIQVREIVLLGSAVPSSTF